MVHKMLQGITARAARERREADEAAATLARERAEGDDALRGAQAGNPSLR